MESYPRQCAANGQTFTEEIEMCASMSIDNAFAIAGESVCASEGALLSAYVCNEGTNTLWIDLAIDDMEGCSPACVVNVLTGEAEINYRCTGLIVEESDSCDGLDYISDSENNSYKLVSIGNQCWMAENLKIGLFINSEENMSAATSVPEKWCYNNNESLCELEGGLYSWNEAMSIHNVYGLCPEGFKIPSDDDFKALEIFLGMTQEQADDVEDVLHRGTDQGTQLKLGGSSGFDAIMPGFLHDNREFYGNGLLTQNDQVYFWTSTEEEGKAYVRGLSNLATVRRQLINKDSGLSIRCIKI
jgi:uncharacterized protein (TIGR02145 family)